MFTRYIYAAVCGRGKNFAIALCARIYAAVCGRGINFAIALCARILLVTSPLLKPFLRACVSGVVFYPPSVSASLVWPVRVKS